MLLSLFLLPIQTLCTVILWIMGWRLLIDPFPCAKRVIVIFSHTSRWDFILYLLYKHSLVWPQSSPRVYVLVMPQLFDYLGGRLGWLLASMDVLPGARLEHRGTGAVNKVAETLNSNDEFALLISPKGCTVNTPWRSGYYRLAQQTHSNFCVTGLDYHLKTLVYSDLVEMDEQSIIERELKQRLGVITPLYPEGEVVECKVSGNQSLVDSKCLWRLVAVGSVVVGIVYRSCISASV